MRGVRRDQRCDRLSPGRRKPCTWGPRTPSLPRENAPVHYMTLGADAFVRVFQTPSSTQMKPCLRPYIALTLPSLLLPLPLHFSINFFVRPRSPGVTNTLEDITKRSLSIITNDSAAPHL